MQPFCGQNVKNNKIVKAEIYDVNIEKTIKQLNQIIKHAISNRPKSRFEYEARQMKISKTNKLTQSSKNRANIAKTDAA